MIPTLTRQQQERAEALLANFSAPVSPILDGQELVAARARRAGLDGEARIIEAGQGPSDVEAGARRLVQVRTQAELLGRQIVKLEGERDAAQAAREAELAVIRSEARALLAEIGAAFLEQHRAHVVSTLEPYCKGNVRLTAQLIGQLGWFAVYARRLAGARYETASATWPLADYLQAALRGEDFLMAR